VSSIAPLAAVVAGHLVEILMIGKEFHTAVSSNVHVTKFTVGSVQSRQNKTALVARECQCCILLG
jgi:hypothetical protein